MAQPAIVAPIRFPTDGDGRYRLAVRNAELVSQNSGKRCRQPASARSAKGRQPVGGFSPGRGLGDESRELEIDSQTGLKFQRPVPSLCIIFEGRLLRR